MIFKLKYPDNSTLPTILKGVVFGARLRLESSDGSELYLEPSQTKTWRGDHFALDSWGPIEIDGKWYGVPHQQKQSKKGWLKTEPNGFHAWYWNELQDYSRNPDGGFSWKPGTESGWYFRRPFSWRWDNAGTVEDGVLRHWIFSGGYLGKHWD